MTKNIDMRSDINGANKKDLGEIMRHMHPSRASAVQLWLDGSSLRSAGQTIGRTGQSVRIYACQILRQLNVRSMRRFKNLPVTADDPKRHIIDTKTMLADLPISLRTLNALNNNEIKTVGEVVSLSKDELLLIPNLGRRCVNELDLFFSAHDVRETSKVTP